MRILVHVVVGIGDRRRVIHEVLGEFAQCYFSGSFPLLRSKLPAVRCNSRLGSDLVIALFPRFVPDAEETPGPTAKQSHSATYQRLPLGGAAVFKPHSFALAIGSIDELYADIGKGLAQLQQRADLGI